MRQCFENFQHLPPTPDLSGFIELKKDDENTLAIFTQNNDCNTNNVDPPELQITTEIQSNDLHNGNILDSTETQILVQMDSNTTLYNIDQKTIEELKPEMNEMKNFNVKVSLRYSTIFIL